MADWRNDYWREAIANALEDVGKHDALTSAEYDQVAASLAVSQECMSQASAPVENPLIGENSRLKRLIETERQDAQKAEWVYQDHIAARYRGEVHVSRRGKEIEISPKR